MSRRSELLRIRAELATARQRALAGPHSQDATAQPLLGVAARRIGEVSAAWKARVDPTAVEAASLRTPPGMQRDLALGIELIYEGWALHVGAPRLTSLTGDDEGLAILVGDWCYAAGLCEVADTGNLGAVARLAALIADLSAAADEPVDALEGRWDAAFTELGVMGQQLA